MIVSAGSDAVYVVVTRLLKILTGPGSVGNHQLDLDGSNVKTLVTTSGSDLVNSDDTT